MEMGTVNPDVVDNESITYHVEEPNIAGMYIRELHYFQVMSIRRPQEMRMIHESCFRKGRSPERQEEDPRSSYIPQAVVRSWSRAMLLSSIPFFYRFPFPKLCKRTERGHLSEAFYKYLMSLRGITDCTPYWDMSYEWRVLSLPRPR